MFSLCLLDYFPVSFTRLQGYGADTIKNAMDREPGELEQRKSKSKNETEDGKEKNLRGQLKKPLPSYGRGRAGKKFEKKKAPAGPAAGRFC